MSLKIPKNINIMKQAEKYFLKNSKIGLEIDPNFNLDNRVYNLRKRKRTKKMF